jgi:glycosyl transferase family 1
MPDLSDFYAGPAYKQELSQLLGNLSPDALCTWTVDAVAATAKPFSPKIPRLAFLVEMDHLMRRYRRRNRPARSLKGRIYQLADELADRRLPKLIVKLLSDCEVVMDHAAHHCEWLRAQGVSQAKYLPVPVLDRAGSEWLAARKRALSGHKVPRITLIGNVTGTATLAGLSLLAREVLPEIEQRCGADEYEVHIIGGGTLPADLAETLSRPCVKRRGYVEDIHEEFRASDILLVPTPIDLGFRVRIAEGFSFGCCVVAHRANGLGMPELRDGENTLMADTGSGLAEAVVRCLRSPALRDQLGAAARATFEQVLDGRIVCDQMIDELESIASTSETRRTPQSAGSYVTLP